MPEESTKVETSKTVETDPKHTVETEKKTETETTKVPGVPATTEKTVTEKTTEK